MTHFYSCDWGTSSFRLRRVNAASGTVLDERRDATGVRALFASCPAGDTGAREKAFADFFGAQLRSMAGHKPGELGGAAVVISGMASSSVGWRELPYACVPLNLNGSTLVQRSFPLIIEDGLQARILLISGVRTANDIMRGEETEILGLFSDGRHPRIARDGIVVLPGTHSKHARLHDRQMTSFTTYMTGELFDVLSAHSLLRASVQAADGPAWTSWEDPDSREAFAQGVRSAASPGLAPSLFQTRVRTVLEAVLPPVNRWFLSGLLIGAEAEGLTRAELDVPILLAAVEPLSAAYLFAFQALGLGGRLTVAPPDAVALASVLGHRALLQRWLKSEDNAASQ